MECPSGALRDHQEAKNVEEHVLFQKIRTAAPLPPAPSEALKNRKNQGPFYKEDRHLHFELFKMLPNRVCDRMTLHPFVCAFVLLFGDVIVFGDYCSCNKSRSTFSVNVDV